jgi:hypothetical protein
MLRLDFTGSQIQVDGVAAAEGDEVGQVPRKELPSFLSSGTQT